MIVIFFLSFFPSQTVCMLYTRWLFACKHRTASRGFFVCQTETKDNGGQRFSS